MRTTLTLAEDVAARVDDTVRRSGRSKKEIVDEALRLGLGLVGKTTRPPRFKVRAHSFGFKPGIDLDRMNQLADELEVEEVARKLRG